MRGAILSFVLGVAWLQQQAELFALDSFAVTFLLLTVLVYFSIRLNIFLSRGNQDQVCRSKEATKLFLLMRCLQLCMAFGLGFCWAGLVAHYHMREILPSSLESRDIVIVGAVNSLPNRIQQGTRFQFSVERYLLDSSHAESADFFGATLPKQLSLAWFGTPDNRGLVPSIEPGQRWRLTVRLKRVHGNANPHGVDYEVWSLEQGVRATGTVRASSSAESEIKNQLLDEFVWSPGNVLERIRFGLREKIFQALPSARYVGVLSALVVGDQREISASDWGTFNRTGVGHLISISGLHITMIAGIFAGLMHYLWRHSFFTRAQLPLRIPAPKIAVLAGLLAAALYVALAGFGVPAQRTLWMLLVFAIAVWSGRPVSSTYVLCLALGIVVVIDPWAVLSPGFYLSFGAVAVLLYASVGRAELASESSMTEGVWPKIVAQLRIAARLQYAITLGLVPLTLLLFSQISVVGPIANALAIPLVSFVVTPLALVGSVLPAPLAEFCLTIAHTVVAFLAKILEYLSASPIAVWQSPVPTWWMFLLAIVGLLWLLAPRGIPLRVFGGICCLPMLIQTTQRPDKENMLVTVFDIGQGAAVLIETNRHRLLYDTGPGLSLESNSGTRILLPYLQARGISHLDQLVLSHSDNDHVGGAASILQNVKVDQLLSSLAIDHPLGSQAKNSQRCVAGQGWVWDGVHFEVLHPVPVMYTSDKWKPNALSCTLKVSTKSHSILLAGDIEAIQEDQLVNRIPQKLKSDVLLAPHHGSGTSSTLAFLQAVAPQIALFQVGYLNRYHHPKPEVMQRYYDFGIKPLRTDKSGAITLQFGGALTISEYRIEHARYWYK